MTLDEELFAQFKAENKLEAGLTLDQVMAPPT
jgi:hypothetical protein